MFKKIKNNKLPVLLLKILLILLFFSCSNSDKYKNLPPRLAELNKQIDKFPKSDTLYFQRAYYYYIEGNLESALEDITKASKLKPNREAYLSLLADIYFSQLETDLAEETLEKILIINPGNNGVRLKLAELYFHLNMISECENVLNKAVELQHHNPEAQLIRAFCCKERGDTTGYIRMLLLTIDQNPQEIKAYLELGYFYQQKLDPVALQYYNNALLVDPDNIEINYNIAVLYQDLGDYQYAEDYYSNVLKLNSFHIGALNNLGFLKFSYEKKYEEALKYFNQAIQERPDFIIAYANRGYCYLNLKEYDKAKQDFQYCLQIDSEYEYAKEGLKQIRNK